MALYGCSRMTLTPALGVIGLAWCSSFRSVTSWATLFWMRSHSVPHGMAALPPGASQGYGLDLNHLSSLFHPSFSVKAFTNDRVLD